MKNRKWYFDRKIYGVPSFALRFADGGGAADPGAGGKDGGKEGGAGAGTEPANKTYTQAELDDKISKAVSDAMAKAKPPAAETPKKDDPKTEPEGKKAESDPAPDAKLQSANARLVQSAAKIAALGLGIPAARADYAVRMADLSGVKVDDKGDPDADAAKKAVEKVLADIPELKGGAGFRVGAPDSGGKGGAAKKVSYQDAIKAHYKQ